MRAAGARNRYDVPMPVRLFHQDAYLTRFTAHVARRGERNGQPFVVLDRTAFYATSGGQPYDTGTLGNARVVDVVEDGDEILHLLDRPLDGDEVQGVVDWPRRHDHMQQHHGQHLLSQAFVRAAHAETVSFHLGAETSTIDLDVPDIHETRVWEAEEIANRVVFEDREVSTRFSSADEVRKLPLRKPPTVREDIRIVSVPDFDHSACGGTHPRRTGEVGLIKVLRWERWKGTVRVEFVCGLRALREFRARAGWLAQACSALSTSPSELPGLLAKRLEDAEATRRRAKDLEQRLAVHDAAELFAAAPEVHGVRLVVASFEGRDPDILSTLARGIRERGRSVALLGTRTDKASLLFSASDGVAVDLREAMKEACGVLGGKGGGRPNHAQGGGNDASRLDEAMAKARAVIESQLVR